jgi:hypothetical protein
MSPRSEHSTTSVAANARYGVCTELAEEATVPASGRINQAPTSGAIVVPTELNAWVRVSRLDAVSGEPRTATYGFAATWSSVKPDASTKSAPRNSG